MNIRPALAKATSAAPGSVILLNDYAYAQGGGSQVALQQARYLRDAGCDVTLFTAMARQDSPGVAGWLADQPIPTWNSGQWDIAGDPIRFRAASQGLWNFEAARQLAFILSEKNPRETVVLVHGWTKALSASVVHCAIRCGFTVLLVAHDYFAACPNGAYYDFPRQAGCHRRPMSLDCITANCDRESFAQKQWRVLRQGIQKWAAGLPGKLGGVICVSEFQQRLLGNWLPESLPCHVLPNLILPPPENLHADVTSTEVFGFCGRLSPEKGISCLVNAVEQSGVEMLLIGDGPLAPEVHIKLPAAVISGWLDQPSVWRKLAGIRSLIFPSVCVETFGLSVFEAATLGIPAIVTAGTAPSDFVRDGLNGLLFPAGDADELAKKLVALRENPSLAKNLGAQAQRDVQAHLRSPQSYTGELLDILRCAQPSFQMIG